MCGVDGRRFGIGIDYRQDRSGHFAFRHAFVNLMSVDLDTTRLVLHVGFGARTVAVPFRQRRYEP